MKGSSVAAIQRAVRERLGEERTLLAVSGGLDSMVLLHAAAAVIPGTQLVIGTFDHGSGPHAVRATDLVLGVGLACSIPVVLGRADSIERPSEARWRDLRLAFLRAAAFEHRARLATAHTRDDQVETVLFRELRGAGPRGLAGLAAPGGTRRPLLEFRRQELADYARAAGVEWVDDPTNADRSFSRNRLRHDLIPAMRAVRPGIDDDLVEIGRRAARWRADVDAYLEARVVHEVDSERRTLEVRADSLRGLSGEALGIVWPALLAKLGIAADWRGTRRIAAFTTGGSSGRRIQLSGGWTVYRRRDRFEVRPGGKR